MHLVSQELKEMYKTDDFFKSANILKPTNQGVILPFKSYYLRIYIL